jgi:hypothetical protein
MAGVGAPGKYETHVKPKLLLVEAWARDGLTGEEIAKNLGIAKSTLCEYQKIHSELSDSLKNGREVIDTMVENALLKAALGYEFEEDGVGKDGVYRLTKYAHPNTTALIFWLKNRKPAAWRDKQEVDMNATIEYAVTLPKPPDANG